MPKQEMMGLEKGPATAPDWREGRILLPIGIQYVLGKNWGRYLSRRNMISEFVAIIFRDPWSVIIPRIRSSPFPQRV
jgi:hypothetical protein